MKRSANTKARATVPGAPAGEQWLLAGVFFVLFFLYVWLRIEPSVDYQHSAPAFQMSHSFFRPYLAYPGGLVNYAAAFLAQLNYDDRLGALIFTVIGGLVFLVTRMGLSRISSVASPVVPFGLPLVLLLLRDRYDTPALAIGVGLLLGLGLATGYLWLPWAKDWQRLSLCWIAAALLFCGAGLWPCLLFVVLVSLFHFRQRQGRLGWGCALSLLIALPGTLGFSEVSPAKILNPAGSAMPGILFGATYVGIALVAGVLALWPSAPAPANEATPARGRDSKVVPARRWIQTRGARGALAASSLLLGWAAVWLAFDDSRKTVAQMDCYASRKEYERVLTVAGRIEAMDSASSVRLHRALYHTGRLGQDLFSFTNQTVWDLMPALIKGLEACRPQSETLLELGQVNLAEHFAHEALEWEGERPDLLRLLANINLLKGRPKAARIFVNVLGQIPFQQEHAGACRRDLEADPRLPGSPELTQIRSRMVSSDLPHNTLPTESILRQLLHTNRRNQMAFEYLMAHYLLTKQIDKAVEELGRLSDFNYAEIPRHYEEAILLFQYVEGREVDLRGRTIRPATRRRFQEFAAALQRRDHDTAAGQQALARDFGDTFWYHYAVRQMAVSQSTGGTTQQ